MEEANGLFVEELGWEPNVPVFGEVADVDANPNREGEVAEEEPKLVVAAPVPNEKFDLGVSDEEEGEVCEAFEEYEEEPNPERDVWLVGDWPCPCLRCINFVTVFFSRSGVFSVGEVVQDCVRMIVEGMPEGEK